MKNTLLSTVTATAFCLLMAFSSNAQSTTGTWTKQAPTNTIAGVKFSDLPQEKQEKLRKQFAENNLTVEDDALVFFLKKSDGVGVYQTAEDKLIRHAITKDNVVVTDIKATPLKESSGKRQQKIIIQEDF